MATAQTPASAKTTAAQFIVVFNQDRSADDDRTPTLADYGIELNPPTGSRLFRLESERQLKERMKSEFQNRPGERNERIEFPKEPALSADPYKPRQLAGLVKQIEPNYVCHHRLYFEELNAERYGWDLGLIQPVVSTGYFVKDVLLWPQHIATRPHQRYECSAGHCMPGDPVPYLIYPPEWSVSGSVVEAGTIVALYALIP